MVPFATSQFKDEHGLVRNDKVFNERLCGFEVEVKVRRTVYVKAKRARDNDDPIITTIIDQYEVLDMYKDAAHGHTVYADEQIMTGDNWIKMILAIPQNKKIIEERIEEGFESNCLRKEMNIVVTDFTDELEPLEPEHFSDLGLLN